MTILASGAKGATLENSHKVLNLLLAINSDTINNDYYSLVSQSRLHDSDTRLLIADAFYANKTLPVYPSYISLCQKFYSADCQSVDKTGSQAAAVTEIEIRATGAAPNPNQKPFKMIVNRPFIFMIYDNQTKLILFIGSIYHPEKIQ